MNTSQKLERCTGCGAPLSGCVCDLMKPISSKFNLMILRHPQEAKSKLGTAELLAKACPKLVLKTGFSWRNISHAFGSETKPSEWVVLFLGSKKLHPRIAETGEPLVLVDKKGAPLENQNESKKIRGIILLDGNWSQSKTLWWRNAWLTRCQRGILNPTRKSQYKNTRREPRKESLSTLEALASTLEALESSGNNAEALRDVFSKFLERQRGPKPVRESKVSEINAEPSENASVDELGSTLKAQ